MSSITSLAANLSNSVNNVQTEIVSVQNQLMSGIKTLNPAQNGVVTRLNAQATGWGVAADNITAAQNVITVAQTGLSSIVSIVNQMKQLSSQASSAGLTTSDKNSLNTTFQNLAAQIRGIELNSSVNGNNLLAGTPGFTVTTGISGNASTASSTTGIAGVDIPSLATTLSALSVLSGASTRGTVTTPTPTVVTAGAGSTAEVDSITFTAMSAGDSFTVAGLTFVANQSLTASQAGAAFASLSNGATTGPSTTYGAYAGTLQNYSSGTNSAGTISFTYYTAIASPGTVAVSASQVSNADYATQILTTALTTITTAQSTISAGQVGLNAQLANVIALKNGLTNTVNAIQNVDATALQAKLQQLNNQQSIDYYLVSQMNTEASAILSIFR
ncbi:flagellin [Polynucleobacter sp. UB-Raua-W9]|uniref:flagellin n=1 Tax=Polynucleobacter sp. UB-Raua-W9 TaxID=1819736 RepID=UPI001BFCFC1C|nr:flagellin [Polynucleobacter sp. UB-Raua-W9]QWD71790.1 flagellin [Polynucleobacter sp. UB-Raua-W9]